jgi:CRISPR-associated endonuclease Cas2
MPKHKPIQFETTLELNLKKYISDVFKENQKVKTVLNATLGIIAMGGIITFGAAFPAILGEVHKMRQHQKKEKYERYQQIWRNFDKLKKQRMLEFVKEEDGHMVYKTNKKGEEKIKKFIFDELKINEQKKWDGKWRLVIFDIPEIRKNGRHALRRKLKELGFYQCQKSAWVHPLECEFEIEFIKDILNLKPFVKNFIIEKIDDGKVIYYFKNLLKKTS